MMRAKETAMIQLTEEQRRELDAPEPVAIDPHTQDTYVLVRKALYDRLKGLLEEDDARLMYPGLAGIDPEDWEDASIYEHTP
jgi:hypothetical protein